MDGIKEASSLTQTYEDRLRLAKVNTVVPPVDFPNFTLTINTSTAGVWAYHDNKYPLYKGLWRGGGN